MSYPKILLSHGSGGRLTHALIQDIFVRRFKNPILGELSDSARLDGLPKTIAFTCDAFVVSPIFFSGGDIGKLAVCGTINDLVMQGAVPEYLSLALIIEEGLEYKVLESIADSISRTARLARVLIVTGDTKVVEKNAADKVFITTSGIGRIMKGRHLSVKNIEPGDKIIVTGDIACHGLAVLSGRKDLNLGFTIKSDCAFLHTLLIPVLEKYSAIKFMRDPTRGGLATTLNEVAEAGGLGITIEEGHIPLAANARAACELLGIDPLYIACEGRAIMVVEKDKASDILSILRRHPLGRNARIIGSVTKGLRAKVILNTRLGTRRIVDMLTSEPLPRIC
ncbi:MAG: hydrogenase expression/formation protein HypE [Candidatus Omnitrophica bacterium]|nr:hydrogenase expression/formation protein HypE [Candidatus Omnitrophota bacterium]